MLMLMLFSALNGVKHSVSKTAQNPPQFLAGGLCR